MDLRRLFIQLSVAVAEQLSPAVEMKRNKPYEHIYGG